ncbi:sensor histidine kinase [Brasilonema sp. UFV-L1]|uniref:sensor histidine kinase n=1 Tax=Brasilonema sp. UFV-L1 TaxID=2234130 RepID=UPI00145C92BF|nr:sensor histidine kinase [Brasilonema sp. UFV-L1]NMG09655.1 sensor histidine kinase [Brasilonema sp. UFV-L1]
MDYSHLLSEKTNTIVENWVKAVRVDKDIESADSLPRIDIRNHIPHVLAAMATVLSQSTDSNIELLVRASLTHGVFRSQQGFDSAEIALEYRLLRQEIFAAINADLQLGTVAEVIRAMRVIDAVVDEAIAQCFKSYTEERLRELKQLQSQLMLTNEELNRLVSATQDNFSQLAHELKTPLNSIINYSDLFLRQVRHRPEVRDTLPSVENIERVIRNSRQLLSLINSTLELSRCEAGKMQLRVMSIDVRSVINAVMEIMEPLAAAKGLVMMVDCSQAPNQVMTDPLRLQQIITNLLSNAIRYTESGTVQLTCQMLSDQQWCIAICAPRSSEAIADTGVGISQEDQLRVFDPFFRASSTLHARLPDSTGLGLAIVKQLVKLMQGKIELESLLGVGSTFTVILPLEIKTIS